MIISLNGKWHIKDSDNEFSFLGNVPGTVQGDLVDLNFLPHPYKGLNEELFLRLEEKDWEYKYDFEIHDLSQNIYELVFCGIDTLSYIYLNDEFLGKTQDMFLEYRFPVKNILKKGKNTVKVKILSPIKEPSLLMQNYGRLAATHEYDVRPYIRKAQYSYGWDWGARIATSGIWRDVFIEVREDARLYGSTAYLENLNGTIRVTGYIDDMKDDVLRYKVKVYLNEAMIGEFPVQKDIKGARFEGKFKKDEISLWYPHGLGRPVLHNFKFIFTKDNREIYKEEKKIGLRMVKLVQEKDEEGKSFIFYINGKPIFVKGANWIPGDNILSWLSEEDYEKLIQMAYDTNINMLRVWGGGIYEDEIFYEKCDELGIMVWQDFMFACAEYPDHLQWFRELANKEVRENVIKLRYHPSIVLWCGNNENNWGFDEWPLFVHKVDGKFLGNRLYLEDFPKLCAEEDPSCPYWPSSPYGGTRPNAEDGGDRHNWNVWSGWQGYDAYTKDHGRFLSEFGFQGAPDPKTVEFFAKEKDRSIFSRVMTVHNKQEEGPERIMKFIHNYFGLVIDFSTILYLSQINQAEAIKTGVEHWRGRKYKTAGTIYWQFNDSWPVFSWSAIDYFKRPKALYYYSKIFYQDILPVAIKYKDKIILKIINDSSSLYGNLKVSAFNMEKGEKVWMHWYKNLRVGDDSVLEVDNLSFKEFKNTILFMRFDSNRGIYKNSKLLANLREVKLLDPEIDIKVDKDTITVRVENPAYGIYIKGKDISDNYFYLSPEETKVVKVKNFEKAFSMYDFINEVIR